MKPEFPTTDLTRHLREALSVNAFTANRWIIHGRLLECLTDDPNIEALVAQSLRFFPGGNADKPPDLRWQLTGRSEWAVPGEAEILPASSNERVDLQREYGLTAKFARCNQISYFELAPLAGAAYEFSSGCALAYLRPGTSLRPRIINNLFLQTVLLELLRAVELYWVHAACVVEAGRAVLLVGPTGSGKTTTALNLVQAGFRFLSQDRTLIRCTDPLTLLSFPEDLAVAQKTLDLLPAFSRRLGPLPIANGKHQIDPGALGPGVLAETANPALILFPRLTDADQSALQPVSPVRALQRLLPNSLLASDPGVTRQHFEALARLVEASRSFELSLGPDVEAVPRLIRRSLVARSL